mmetsp:Transcript_7116/g.17685  ORF Transcript_7116/g.17685 Transcript_7116/m.17685 type:complete len:207 (-) Transcript_7116:195-815(-)
MAERSLLWPLWCIRVSPPAWRGPCSRSWTLAAATSRRPPPRARMPARRSLRCARHRRRQRRRMRPPRRAARRRRPSSGPRTRPRRPRRMSNLRSRSHSRSSPRTRPRSSASSLAASWTSSSGRLMSPPRRYTRRSPAAQSRSQWSRVGRCCRARTPARSMAPAQARVGGTSSSESCAGDAPSRPGDALDGWLRVRRHIAGLGGGSF